MVTVKDVEAQKLINKLKEELKKVNDISPPEWINFVKSGVHKERIPEQDDFWYIRAASILRRVYLDGPVGIQRLRTYFGGRKRMGHKPPHFRKASGSITRKLLFQLEKAELIQKSNKKGRIISNKGRQLLNKIAYEVSK